MAMAGLAGLAGKILGDMISKDTVKVADVINLYVSSNVSNGGDIDMEKDMPKTKKWVEQVEKETEENPEESKTVEVPEEIKKEIKEYLKSDIPRQFIPLYVSGVYFQFAENFSEEDEAFFDELFDVSDGRRPVWEDEELQKAQDKVDDFLYSDYGCFNGYTIFENTMAIDLLTDNLEINPEIDEWIRGLIKAINLLREKPFYFIIGYSFY